VSLYTDFMAAVEQAATNQRCARGYSHGPHDTVDGRCPGFHHPILTIDQTKRLADQARKEIRP
jgi:hypothetical protein